MLGHKGCVCCGGQGEAASVFGESRMISGAVNLLSGERVGWKYMEGLQLGERFDSVGSKGPEGLSRAMTCLGFVAGSACQEGE